MRGTGRVVFAATLLLLAGTLNIIYGIGALDDANIFTDDQRYIFTNLNTLGWVLIVLGVIQLVGGVSLMSGNALGRVIALVGAGLGAIGSLLSIGGAYPWWSTRPRTASPRATPPFTGATSPTSCGNTASTTATSPAWRRTTA